MMDDDEGMNEVSVDSGVDGCSIYYGTRLLDHIIRSSRYYYV
jgi:hypothetical protein